jgi:hypothetical protein
MGNQNQPREGGKLGRDGQWLVITESSYIENKGWEHQCGEALKAVILTPPILDGTEKVTTDTIPYCPICEIVPIVNNGQILRVQN